jgi:hypothetical protein
MNRTLNLSLAACLLEILACLLAVGGRMGRGAPKLKDQPDLVAGQFGMSQDAPVVVEGDGDEADLVWLVFADPAKEKAAVERLDLGDRVTARGTSGGGGPFRYLVVASIEKD